MLNEVAFSQQKPPSSTKRTLTTIKLLNLLTELVRIFIRREIAINMFDPSGSRV